MSHTPGPWWVQMPEGWDEYSEPLIIGGEDDLIANIRRNLTKPDGGAFGEGYYDCLLIAAAPDLLEFVREVHEEAWWADRKWITDAAAALIAKAEGK